MPTEVKMDNTVKGDWSGWSAWRRLGRSLRESCRTRAVTHSWWSREVTWKDVWTCPPGYGSAGGETCYALRDLYPGSPGLGHVPSGSTTPATKSREATYGPWEPHEEKWTESECRYDTRFHDFRSQFEPSVHITPTHTRPLRDREGKKASTAATHARPLRDGEGRKAKLVPNLEYVGYDSLASGSKLTVRGRGTEKSAVLVNGRLLDRRTIDTADLPAGLMILEMTDEIEGVERRFQLIANIVAPLHFTVRNPVAQLRGGEGEPTVRLTASLENRSDSERLVRLQVTSAPEGWQAEAVGKPIRLLRANSRTSVHVTARRWVGVTQRPELAPLAFSLQASSIGSNAAAEVTLYARMT